MHYTIGCFNSRKEDMNLIDVDLVSLHAGVDQTTHWGSAAYLRRFHNAVHAKFNLQLPGRPSLSLLKGDLKELANGAVVYLLSDPPLTCTKLTIRQRLLKPDGNITLLVAPLLEAPIGTWLFAGAKLWSLHLCEALSAGCLLYSEGVNVRK